MIGSCFYNELWVSKEIFDDRYLGRITAIHISSVFILHFKEFKESVYRLHFSPLYFSRRRKRPAHDRHPVWQDWEKGSSARRFPPHRCAYYRHSGDLLFPEYLARRIHYILFPLPCQPQPPAPAPAAARGRHLLLVAMPTTMTSRKNITEAQNIRVGPSIGTSFILRPPLPSPPSAPAPVRAERWRLLSLVRGANDD